MKLIDFHTHIYPDIIAKTATDSVARFYMREAASVGTKDNLVEFMKKYGVDRSVLLPVAVKPAHVTHINNFIRDCSRENSELIPFGAVHASYVDNVGEAERILEYGFKGIKIHPDNQFFNIDDERLYPLFDFMQEKMILLVHAGDPRSDYSHPRRIRKVLDMFPRLTVIAAHFGGWSMPETAVDLLSPKENCYIDISSSFDYIDKKDAERYIEIYSPERVLFGSDFPIGSPETEKKNLLSLNISDEAKEKIAYKNAERLLNIKI